MVISNEMIRVLRWFRAQYEGRGTAYEARMSHNTRHVAVMRGWLVQVGDDFEITGKGLDLLSGLADE